MLQQLVSPLDQFSLLKAQLARQLLHLPHQHIHQHMGVTVKNLPDFGDVLPVMFRRYQPLAAALAAVDMVLQAQAVLACLDGLT